MEHILERILESIYGTSKNLILINQCNLLKLGKRDSFFYFFFSDSLLTSVGKKS